MKTLKPLAFSLALALSGCISATPYQRFSFPRGGYDTKPLQDGIYQIDFAANGVTAQSQAAYYALVRASEVTLQSGRSLFRCPEREDRDETASYEPERHQSHSNP